MIRVALAYFLGTVMGIAGWLTHNRDIMIWSASFLGYGLILDLAIDCKRRKANEIQEDKD